MIGKGIEHRCASNRRGVIFWPPESLPEIAVPVEVAEGSRVDPLRAFVGHRIREITVPQGKEHREHRRVFIRGGNEDEIDRAVVVQVGRFEKVPLVLGLKTADRIEEIPGSRLGRKDCAEKEIEERRGRP